MYHDKLGLVRGMWWVWYVNCLSPTAIEIGYEEVEYTVIERNELVQLCVVLKLPEDQPVDLNGGIVLDTGINITLGTAGKITFTPKLRY